VECLGQRGFLGSRFEILNLPFILRNLSEEERLVLAHVVVVEFIPRHVELIVLG